MSWFALVPLIVTAATRTPAKVTAKMYQIIEKKRLEVSWMRSDITDTWMLLLLNLNCFHLTVEKDGIGKRQFNCIQ